MAAETIIALASAPGLAGVAVLRLSGDKAFHVARGLHTKAEKAIRLPRTLVYGHLKADEREIDDAMLVAMPAPNSYTGEDVIEIYCHGNPLIEQQVIDAAIALGARVAEPGEFTKRAYLNNRLDLVQAEAVADVISASSEQALGLARRQLGGAWSTKLHELEAEVVGLMAHVGAWLDFGEEDIQDLSSGDVADKLEPILAAIRAWSDGAAAAEIMRDGYRVALVGLPNAGKSSLLNALAGFEKAIVTNIPGTTRDTIEHQLHVNGYLIELVDTAGLRDTGDAVESIGIERAKRAATQANLVLVLIGPDQKLEDLQAQLSAVDDQTPRLIVQTKTDLSARSSAPDSSPGTSARTGEGIQELRELLGKRAQEAASGESVITANTRQLAALREAKKSLVEARDAARSGLPLDVLAVNLSAAAESLAAITGTHISESMLDSIFSTFCIGK